MSVRESNCKMNVLSLSINEIAQTLASQYKQHAFEYVDFWI